jgi:hypothetical protein
MATHFHQATWTCATTNLVDVFDGLHIVPDVPISHGRLDVRLNRMTVGAYKAVVRPNAESEASLGLQLASVLDAVALLIRI